jgi:hypothetical protein
MFSFDVQARLVTVTSADSPREPFYRQNSPEMESRVMSSYGMALCGRAVMQAPDGCDFDFMTGAERSA